MSGLASGIDAAAHRGALAAGSAPPIGVVGSGLDTVYPRGQERLWRDVASAGVLLSEAPLGGAPERWRFPARNRVIAALADVVVVVESHRRGGSLHTVDEADRRGVEVMAVPGSVRNPAAAGTNELLAEGVRRRAPPTTCSWRWDSPPWAGRRADRFRRTTGGCSGGGVAGDLDQVALRTGLGVAELAAALDRRRLRLGRRHGGWYGGWRRRTREALAGRCRPGGGGSLAWPPWPGTSTSSNGR